MIIVKAFDKSLFTGPGTSAIKSGDILKIKLVKNLGAGNWQASLKGKLFTVTTNLSFKQGETIKTKALWAGNRLMLKVRDDAAEIRNAAELPQDAVSKSLIDSFIRSSMPIDPGKLKALYEFLIKNNIRDQKAIRLLVIMTDKGLPLDKTLFENLITAVDGDAGRKNQQGRGHGDRKRDQRREDQARSSEIVEKKNDAVRLFNHVKGEHQNWVIIPLSLEHQGFRVDGSLRFRLEGLQIADTMILDLKAGESDWQFLLVPKADSSYSLCRISGTKPAGERENELFREFEQKLRNLGVQLDDTIRDNEGFDGFTFHSEDSYKTIDTVV